MVSPPVTCVTFTRPYLLRVSQFTVPQGLDLYLICSPIVNVLDPVFSRNYSDKVGTTSDDGDDGDMGMVTILEKAG